MGSQLKCDLSDAKDMASEGLPEYVLTQAGCWPSEDNDCGVVALAITTNLPYSLIRKITKVCIDREPKKCMMTMLRACRYLPFKTKKMNRKKFKLGTILERYPEGRYYVEIGGNPTHSVYGKQFCHALAVIDGKIYDRHINPPDRWVRGVWKIDGLKSKSWWGWKIFNPRLG